MTAFEPTGPASAPASASASALALVLASVLAVTPDARSSRCVQLENAMRRPDKLPDVWAIRSPPTPRRNMVVNAWGGAVGAPPLHITRPSALSAAMGTHSHGASLQPVTRQPMTTPLQPTLPTPPRSPRSPTPRPPSPRVSPIQQQPSTLPSTLPPQLYRGHTELKMALANF